MHLCANLSSGTDQVSTKTKSVHSISRCRFVRYTFHGSYATYRLCSCSQSLLAEPCCSHTLHPISIQTDTTRGTFNPSWGWAKSCNLHDLCMSGAPLPPITSFTSLWSSLKWQGAAVRLYVSHCFLSAGCEMRDPFFSFLFCFFPRLCFQKYLLLLRHLFYLMMQGSSG